MSREDGSVRWVGDETKLQPAPTESEMRLAAKLLDKMEALHSSMGTPVCLNCPLNDVKCLPDEGSCEERLVSWARGGDGSPPWGRKAVEVDSNDPFGWFDGMSAEEFYRVATRIS